MPLPPRTNVKTLNPEIERVLFQIKMIEEEAVGLLDGLSENQFNWKPRPDSWSMGQCFDHLNVTAKAFLNNMEASCAKARAEGQTGDGPYVYGFLGRMFHLMTLPPVKRRFSAPAIFRPAEHKSIAAVTSEWAKSHQRMASIVEGANGIDLQRVKVPSPANKWIKLNLGIAFWVMTAHEKRHLWQIRNIRNAIGFPTV